MASTVGTTLLHPFTVAKLGEMKTRAITVIQVGQIQPYFISYMKIAAEWLMTSCFQQLCKVHAAEPGGVDRSLASTGSTRELSPNSTCHKIQLRGNCTYIIKRGKFWRGKTDLCLGLSHKLLVCEVVWYWY